MELFCFQQNRFLIIANWHPVNKSVQKVGWGLFNQYTYVANQVNGNNMTT